ncbi:unnamed protein product [Candida verbasci]|uniref:Uncharacterized protein n=1 Tax=Candida verbasci TaxID=1227364 RepID=A0A9W4XBD5_9ASCO|nr:unnamed protein product [Candida verbasci]
MLIIYDKFYTPMDKYLNKAKRKGFWLYTGIILVSLGYIMYEISNLPELPPDPKDKKNETIKEEKEEKEGKEKKQDHVIESIPRRKSTHAEIEQEEEVDLGPSNPIIPIDQTHEDDHIIYKWSKKKLFQFLFDNKIYPDVSENLIVIRKQVVEIYEIKKQNNELDKKYLS